MSEEWLKNISDEAKQMVEEHVSYVAATLKMHEEVQEVIDKCMYHYRTAAVHFFMHGIENAMEEIEREKA